MLDKLFALRIELVQLLARHNITLEELVRKLGQLQELDLDILKMSIADLVRVEDGRVSLSRDGTLVLQLLR